MRAALSKAVTTPRKVDGSVRVGHDIKQLTAETQRGAEGRNDECGMMNDE
jgi:hypothetical protein